MPFIAGSVKKIPMARLLVAAELLLLARRHVLMLDRQERRRVMELVRHGRGRSRNLTERERRELAILVQKMAPREFASTATKKLVGVSLPGSKAGAKRS